MVQHEGLTPAQDKALSLLPIPSAILSIFGSSVILYMAISTRRERKWTTYTRLLIGLSVCDIISSVSLALAAFLRRPESGRIWAIGNDATCAIIGTLTQFSYSNIFFNAMLSYYFMITVRFQMKQSRIARYLEPWMHLVSIGFPLLTSAFGAYYGMYGEKATGMGCWVNEYPHGCGDEPVQEPCTSGMIGWIYLGLPLLFSGFSILINNLIIGCYVRAPIKSSSASSAASAPRSRTVPTDTASTSTGDFPTTKMDKAHEHEQEVNKQQLRRLRLISSQAFLFVASYILCNVWVGTLGIAEAVTKEENEPQLMHDLYYLMVVNAFFCPLQGFLNMFVYIRPKYLKNRHDFPMETKLWAVRRAILGERVRAHRFIVNKEEQPREQGSGEPTKGHASGGSMKDVESNESSVHSLPNNRGISSITLSHWDDFDQDRSERSNDVLLQSERWVDGVTGDVSNAVPTRRRQSEPHHNFRSSLTSLDISLPFISENAKTELEADDTSCSEHDANDGVILSVEQTSEARWGSDTGKSSTRNRSDSNASSSKTPLVLPNRAPSEHDDDELAIVRMWAASMGFQVTSPTSNDAPLTPPTRVPSEHDLELVETEEKKVTFRRFSLVPPQRIPSDHDMVVVLPPKKAFRRSSLVPPERLPSNHDMVKVETDKNRPTVRRSSLVPPKRYPSDQDMKKRNHNKRLVTDERSLSPFPPSRVPTDCESTNHDELEDN